MDTYEKKYKEAQKWIESIYPNLSHEQQMEAEAFFPELAESEDEKIRKEIISFIKDDINEINLKMSGDYDDRDEDDIAHKNWCKKAISWLENIPYTIDHEKREGFHLGYKAGLEKQGEKSLTVDIESMIEALRTEYEKGRADVIAKACQFLNDYQEYPDHDISPTQLMEAFRLFMQIKD